MRRISITLVLSLLTAVVCAQDLGSDSETLRSQKNAVQNPAVRNPFDINSDELMMGYGAMEMDDEGMDDMYEYEASVGPSRDDLFRAGLQRAIVRLKEAKTDSERAALQGYVQKAFADRYDRMIGQRKKSLARLKQQITQLENDLKRREAAKDRVIQLQLQSVQLAAEGLLELNELRGVPELNHGGGGMYPMGMAGGYGDMGPEEPDFSSIGN